MLLDESLKIIGNGNSTAGLEMVTRLALYLEVARYKHPTRDRDNALQAIMGEVAELTESVARDRKGQKPLSLRSIDEAYDVLTTVVRLINGEYTDI